MKHSLLIISILLTSGCAFGPKMRELRLGLDREQVIAQLGRPDGATKISDDVEKLQYAQRATKRWAADIADYFVILKDDKVVSYGTGEVHHQSDNTSFIVPLTIPQPDNRPMPPAPPLMPGYSR